MFQKIAISTSNLMQKSRAMLVVEKPAGRNYFTAAEEVSSAIHSRKDVTRPQKAVRSQLTWALIPIKAA